MPPPETPQLPFLCRGDFIRLLIGTLLVGVFYALCAVPDISDSQARHPAHRYFAWQAESWLAGRLDMVRPSPDKLRALPDPYDPITNTPLRMAGIDGVHDLSFYKGKLYMYWGPTPTLLTFLPWRALTGQHLPSAWASWAFALAGWMAGALLLIRATRKHFPNLSSITLHIALAGLAVCNWTTVVLQRASVWEVPIFSAVACGIVAWWLLAECLWAERPNHRWRWLAAASMAWALAIGSRPIWIVGTIILAVPLWSERSQWREASFRKLVLAAAIPVGAGVAALLLYNFVRFDAPLEFGQHWQLAAVRVQDTTLFSPSYAGFNLREYLFSLPQAVAYFPFVKAPIAHPPPTGHFGTEMTFGLLAILPWLWWAGLAPLRITIIPLIAPVALSFLCLLGILIGFAGATARYQLELAAPLALLAGFGFLAATSRMSHGRWLGTGVGLVTLTISVLMLLAINSRVSRYMNGISQPPPWVLRLTHWASIAVGWSSPSAVQAVEMTVRLPAQDTLPTQHTAQALISSGIAPWMNAIAINYPSAQHVRFHYFCGPSSASSELILLDRSTPHTFRFELGPMLPPPHHPFWKNTSPEEVTKRRSQIRVLVNGSEAIRGNGDAFIPERDQPEIGAITQGHEKIHVFTGQILSTKFIRVTSPE